MGTLVEQLHSEHPWIKEYFHGERAEALSKGVLMRGQA
jgi:ABC-type transporter Mla maintaining outer membrane lipid asymmetry ATPase subunit MlaF